MRFFISQKREKRINVEYFTKRGGKDMVIKTRIYGNSLYVEIEGELDHHNTEILREALQNAIIKKHVLNIIFDFSKLKFIDSSGVGLILGRYKEVKEQGGKVGIVNANQQVDRVIDISGLKKIIKTFKSSKEAIKEFEGV